MPYVRCYCEECKNNVEGECDAIGICISNDELTAAGFIPRCMDYEEDERSLYEEE